MFNARQSAARIGWLSSTFLAALLAASPVSYADDSTWNNQGTDFNDGGSWTDGVPGAGNAAIFSTTAVTDPNLSDSLSIGMIHFSTANASGYTISASNEATLTLTGSTAILATNTSGTNTASASLTLTSGSKIVDQAPGGKLVISGDIKESGGVASLALQRTGTGGFHTITLSGDNTYTGGTSLSGVDGRLNIGSSTALGTGALTQVTSTHYLDNTSGEDLTLTNALNLNGPTFIFSGTSRLKMTGAVLFGGPFGGARNIRVNDNTLHLTGAITENMSRGLTKQGAGTLILDGTSNHSGATTVSAGTLIINGNFSAAAGAVNVNNSGTLGGTGIVGGATTVNSGGKLAPGSSPGTLTFANNLTLANNSSLIFEAGDLVAVDGTLALTNNWILVLGSGFQDGGSVTLFTYDAIAANPDLVPTFNTVNLGFAPSDALSLSDTGSSIVLHGVSAVPEPGSLSLAVAGLILISRRRAGRINASYRSRV